MDENNSVQVLYGYEPLQAIEYLTKHAAAVQIEVLSTILERNAQTEYLAKYGMKGQVDRQSFKSCLPIVAYEDIEPEIQRIANGDSSPILSAVTISEFLTSSGTSAGERKLMPSIAEDLDRKQFLYSLLMPVMNQYLPGLDEGKGLYFLFIKSETRTPSGLKARPVLTSYYKSPHFKERPFDPYNVYTSPIQTILCPDNYQSMYCQMLCGLIENLQVLRMGAVFASGFLRAIKFLEDHWRELCEDIQVGELNDTITEPSVRNVVSRLLHPDPQLAQRIKAECSKSSWQGIICRLWPRVKYIEVIVTGTMSQYIPLLDYYSGGLPLVCTMYASSECYFGLNLNPLCKPSEVSYTLLPNMAYFEFLPVERAVTYQMGIVNGKEEEKLVDLVDVKIGKEYELVVTTYSGLYRYRVGDVLRVTGFHNTAPQFQFICRKNVVLSIDSEKTDEEGLHKAVRRAAKYLETLGATLIEYTSYADTSTIPGHYALFWEIQSQKEVEKSVFEYCCFLVEESLDSVYRQCRNSDRSIGPLEIRLVENGTFDQLMDYCLNRGSSFNQYKTPRCITFKPVLELLNSKVTSKYFSPKCPFWDPNWRKWSKTESKCENEETFLYYK